MVKNLFFLLLIVILLCGCEIQPQNLCFSTTDSMSVIVDIYDENDCMVYSGFNAGYTNNNHNYKMPNTHNKIYKAVVYDEYRKKKIIEKRYKANVDSLLHIEFIACKQGLSVYLKYKDFNMLYDAGFGSSGYSEWQGSGVNYALEYLIKNNIEELSLVVISHNHSDHIGGLSDIMKSDIDVKRIITHQNKFKYTDSSYLYNDDVKIKILSLHTPAGYSENNINNQSIVLKIVYDEFECLLSGDAEDLVFNYLLRNGKDLSSDVYQVSHHGSKNKVNSDKIIKSILNQISKIAIFSFGKGNPYNHPEVVGYDNVSIYGTDEYKNLNDFKFENIEIKTNGKLIFIKKRG